ncbi:MAG: hypothetical protein M3336_16625, partial [Chloroflexota bacterium]|nr:hypothetical protein [Chloroflexota bacterium]
MATRLLALGAALGLSAVLGLTYGLGSTTSAIAQVTSGPASPISGRIYVANEGSTSVSVFDATTNALVTTICLGSDREDDAIPGTPGMALANNGSPCDGEADHHKPFYDGHLGTHGLWLTPDGSTLLVTNRISGTVVAVDTASNRVLGYAPTGREPHLATVRPGGQEAWVAVRSNGSYAFVAHDKSRSVQKVDAAARQVVAAAPVPFPFTPFGLVTPDDRELY